MKKIVVITGIGFAFGVLMATFMLEGPLHNWLLGSPKLMAFYNTINTPAIFIAFALQSVLSVRSDGFGLFAVAVVVQWLVIGVLASSVFGIRSKIGSKPTDSM